MLMDIESLAISIITKIISETDLLEPFIMGKDKEPSWDGFICIHQDKSKNKKGIKRVPVQVKGREINKFQNTIIYPIEVTDLENYYREGGTVFFVVGIDPQKNSRAYYICLLPLDIKEILGDPKKQKTINMPLSELPLEKKKFETLLLTFYDNMKRQTNVSTGITTSIKELMEHKNLERIQLLPVGYDFDENIPEKSLFSDNNSWFAYAEVKGIGTLIPVGSIEKKSSVLTREIKGDVSVNGKTYFDSYIVIYSYDFTTIKIGNCLMLNIHKDTTKAEIQFRTASILTKYIAEMDFILNVLESGSITIKNHNIEVVSIKNPKGIKIEEQKNLLKYLLKIQELLERLNITKELMINLISKQEHKLLYILFEALLYNHIVSGLPNNLAIINKIKIANINIVLVCEHIPDEELDVYRISDLSKMDLSCLINDNKGGTFIATKYASLGEQDYVILDNIDYNDLIKSVNEQPESEQRFDFSNAILLKLILANDTDHTAQRWEAIKALSEFLRNIAHGEEQQTTALINYLQIIKRERTLNDQEKQQLFMLLEENRADEGILIGIYLLLDNTTMAMQHFQQLSQEVQEEFAGFPIYKRFMPR
jgi:hypothetical protein